MLSNIKIILDKVIELGGLIIVDFLGFNGVEG